MSKFKLEFTLQQHTPIIHFQSEQSGATLRATELKPKLDRFLLEYAFEDDFEKYKEFLIGYESIKKQKKREPVKSDFDGKLAFEYKVKIIANSFDIKTERIEKIHSRNGKDINDPLFFGNMKPKDMSVEEFEKIRKKFRIYSKTFKIEFFSFHSKVLKAIENKFEAFLANTNFGTRQSKGFGSFYLVNENNGNPKPFNKDLIPYKVYSFPSKKNRYREDIKLLYSFLRQGINYLNSNP